MEQLDRNTPSPTEILAQGVMSAGCWPISRDVVQRLALCRHSPGFPFLRVSRVAHIRGLKKILDRSASGAYTMELMDNGETDIRFNNPEQFVAVTNILKDNSIQYYVKTSKSGEIVNFLLLGLSPSAKMEDACEELEAKGLVINMITNLSDPLTRRALPLFLVQFGNESKVEDIVSITHLLGAPVQFQMFGDIQHVMRRLSHPDDASFTGLVPRCRKCYTCHRTFLKLSGAEFFIVNCYNCNRNHYSNDKNCTKVDELKLTMHAKLDKIGKLKYDVPTKLGLVITTDSYSDLLSLDYAPALVPSTAATDLPPSTTCLLAFPPADNIVSYCPIVSNSLSTLLPEIRILSEHIPESSLNNNNNNNNNNNSSSNNNNNTASEMTFLFPSVYNVSNEDSSPNTNPDTNSQSNSENSPSNNQDNNSTSNPSNSATSSTASTSTGDTANGTASNSTTNPSNLPPNIPPHIPVNNFVVPMEAFEHLTINDAICSVETRVTHLASQVNTLFTKLAFITSVVGEDFPPPPDTSE